MTLQEIFGPGSRGSTAEEYAATSSRVFVKSQFQLALDNERAKGRRLSALEALKSYGLEFVTKVIVEGGAGFIEDGEEPAATIKRRRTYLKLSKKALAQAAGVDLEAVTRAETPGSVSPVRNLESIAQALSLDERLLGAKSQARGDLELGTRLREMNNAGEQDDAFIIAVSEAAWVIRRQAELADMLKASYGKVNLFSDKVADYNFPAYKKGYALANLTRIRLGIDAEEPIESIYNLAEDVLGIPVVETDLGEGRAGATIINGGSRGIAISKQGANANILVRRMTIAHELAHLLWDPDGQLERVRVEALGPRDNRDPVEIRANAFAVGFLAPIKVVEKILRSTGDFEGTVKRVVSEFGISPVAAINHVANACSEKGDMRNISRRPPVQVLRKWAAAEDRPSLLHSVAESRRGRFAMLAIQAARKGLITVDTLSTWLKVDQRALSPFF